MYLFQLAAEAVILILIYFRQFIILIVSNIFILHQLYFNYRKQLIVLVLIKNNITTRDNHSQIVSVLGNQILLQKRTCFPQNVKYRTN